MAEKSEKQRFGEASARRKVQQSGSGARDEPPELEGLDRTANAMLARVTLGVSPTAVLKDYFTWLSRLALSPGKQFRLAEKAARKIAAFAEYAARYSVDPNTSVAIEPLPQDDRFEKDSWRRFPYNFIHQAFLLNQQWWYNATTDVRGVPRETEKAVSFITRQLLDTFSPSNVPFLNPEITQATIDQLGMNFVRGARNLADDIGRFNRNEPPAGAEDYEVGKDVAVTSGKVVHRNRLMELIQYDPVTDEVYREPVLMMSAWMMKYYILDLSPDNSLVRYLVERGHTVFVLSWVNPGPDDWDLSMEDYRELGFMTALDVVSDIVPERKVHAVGYCLGGILLTIAAAVMARDGDERLATISLFTTLPDFSDVGELGVFMDPREIDFIEDMMWQRGYLDPRQAAGGFRLIRSNDLIWSKMIREYFLGERQPMFDLMAWNADGTRMPFRQHSEFLRRLYRDNELFHGNYNVEGRPISINSIGVPIFSVAAERDHIAPWRSAYNLHLQSDACELTFVLTTGGHNVGIISEPGHPRRSYRISSCPEGKHFPDPDTWRSETPSQQGSWWPAWQNWLAEHSTGKDAAREPGSPEKGYEILCDAPGTYVHQK